MVGVAALEPVNMREIPVELSTPTKLDVIVRRPSWMFEASCRGLDPRPFTRSRVSKPAKLVCSTCPVREPCLEYALSDPATVGTWGGMSETERYEILRDRWRAAGFKRRPRSTGWASGR